ncbi:MAG TPA: hypothetical protein VNR62_02425 [Cellulomonas sp.]|nr:hypothetical protein [Cellulomonas sp.]
MRRVVAALAAAALLAGCSSSTGGITTLAKVDGWRDGFEGSRGSLEIAYDAAATRAMWDDNIASDVPDASGDARRPGVYGSLDRVDFGEQVVVMLSSGQSSSCPALLTKVATSNGVVMVRTDDGTGLFGGSCTADYAYYRVIAAVDRDAVPTAAELDDTTLSIDGFTEAAMGAYPLTP